MGSKEQILYDLNDRLDELRQMLANDDEDARYIAEFDEARGRFSDFLSLGCRLGVPNLTAGEKGRILAGWNDESSWLMIEFGPDGKAVVLAGNKRPEMGDWITEPCTDPRGEHVCNIEMQVRIEGEDRRQWATK